MFQLLLLAACHHDPIEIGDTDAIDTDAIDTEVVDTDTTITDTVITDVAALESRPANPTCVAPPRPANTAQIMLQRRFPDLSFDSPVVLIQSPGDTSRWFVVQQGGVVLRFDNDDAVQTTSVFVDISGRVTARNEMGLLGMAFDPDFATNGDVYLSYTHYQGAQLWSHISRFHSDDGQTLDPDSEEAVLDLRQPYENHNGGNIVFGPDGYLYIGFGDGGSAGDPNDNAQNTNVLLGKMLRIDVHAGDPYGIPADNPFADGVDGKAEIYAWGLRNPWRWSFDTATDKLWLGDVGQYTYEEIDIIDKGGNYGWNDKEGFECFDIDPCDDPEYIDPIWAHPRSEASTITGGYVYHGPDIPELDGVYIYGDFSSSNVFGIYENRSAGELTSRELIDNTGYNISSFAQDPDGNVYLLDYFGGVYEVVRSGPPAEDDFPRKLSETGCADPSDPTQATAGQIPYDLNVAFWSDGADKSRWMAIPDGTHVTIESNGDWTFPIGTVLRKDFRMGGTPFETRLFVRHDDGNWAGYTYQWNTSGTDADYVPSGLTTTIGTQTWSYPSSGECLQCHSDVAGRTLGPETPQMNRGLTYPNGVHGNQIATLAAIGWFDADPGSPVDLPVLPRTDSADATLEERAKAYLHANCSQCHRPNGLGGGPSDFRYTTPLTDMGICDATPDRGDLGIAGARLLAPGDPTKSVISVRIHDVGIDQMPPLARHTVDTEGAALIDEWITSVTTCP